MKGLRSSGDSGQATSHLGHLNLSTAPPRSSARRATPPARSPTGQRAALLIAGDGDLYRQRRRPALLNPGHQDRQTAGRSSGRCNQNRRKAGREGSGQERVYSE